MANKSCYSIQLGGIEVNAFNNHVFESVNFNAFNAQNNRVKQIPLKILMNIVSDFGFFFLHSDLAMRRLGEKTVGYPLFTERL